MSNQLCVWFDIPVTNMDKAVNFYKNVLQRPLEAQVEKGMSLAVFEHKEHELGGCLFLDSKHTPTEGTGPLFYFSVEGRIDKAVEEVTKNGGKVISPVEEIKPWGFRSVIADCCGNKLALHSNKR